MNDGRVRSGAGLAPVFRRCGALLLALLFCALFFLPATAEGAGVRMPESGIDLARKGSVKVVIQDKDGAPVRGGSLQIYFVARVTETDGVQRLTLTDDFSGWGRSADQLVSDHSCADDLAKYIKENSVECLAFADNAGGLVSFNELVPGAYLITQRTPAPSHESILPFLTYIPQYSGAKIVYDFEAYPKPVDKLPPGTVDINAEKIVEALAGVAPEGTRFSFVLKPITSGAPMPKNTSSGVSSEGGSMTVTRTGSGPVKFGTIEFTLSDAGKIYEYSMREIKGSAANYTYDTTVYKFTIRVAPSDDGSTLIVTCVITDVEGKAVDAAVFRNTYKSDGEGDDNHSGGGDSNSGGGDNGHSGGGSSSSGGGSSHSGGGSSSSSGGSSSSNVKPTQIPLTGQLWWPIFVMIPSGISLIVLGIVSMRDNKEDEEEEPV